MNMCRFSFLVILLAAISTALQAGLVADEKRPNILFALADDWGQEASIYGTPVIKTPTFDRIAKQGLLFNRAYVSSPSCTPSRAAIMTGQYHWRLESAANLHSVFLDKFKTFPEMLAKSGYQIGHQSKAWGPGRAETRNRKPTGPRFKSFAEFMKKRDRDKPFFYWLGTSDPHRGYKLNSGKNSGMDLSKIKVPGYFPDSETVRGDIADYFFEVQRFDTLVGRALKQLEEAGELENTLIVMSGDHGMPFPRCKSNLYDSGTCVPLAICWPKGIKRVNQKLNEFVSMTDLAPTFLEVAGIKIPENMTGRTLTDLFVNESTKTKDRSFVLVGKERHVPSQEKPDMGGYPSRAIRTEKYMFIRNYRPDRWPNGTPNFEKATLRGGWYSDTDNSPTKTYMIENRERDQLHQKLYRCSFAKRPAEELYDMAKDPYQLNNITADPKYAKVKAKLAAKLDAELKKTGDLRALGKGDIFDSYPYYGGGGGKHPSFRRKKRNKK